jgi:hypothetical protein
VTKKSKVNTVELVEKINRHLAEQNPTLAKAGVSAMLMDDQTVVTREAIGVMESNAVLGLLVVVGICWLFLGTRVSLLVGLGIPFSLAGTFGVLHALGYTLNISVLLGIVIALGMLVDDAVVVVEAIYYRIQRGQDHFAAAMDALREVIAPVTSSVADHHLGLPAADAAAGHRRQVHVRHPLRRHPGAGHQPDRGLLDAAGPCHGVLRLNLDNPSRMQRWRANFTHTLRVKYARLLIRVMRWPKLSLGRGGHHADCGRRRVRFGRASACSSSPWIRCASST